jgi:hypothetical protein
VVIKGERLGMVSSERLIDGLARKVAAVQWRYPNGFRWGGFVIFAGATPEDGLFHIQAPPLRRAGIIPEKDITQQKGRPKAALFK